MKIKAVIFKDPIRIASHHVNSKGYTSKDFKIELIDYSYFQIRDKRSSALISVIPFQNASECTPEEEDLPLDEAIEEMEDATTEPLDDMMENLNVTISEPSLAKKNPTKPTKEPAHMNLLTGLQSVGNQQTG